MIGFVARFFEAKRFLATLAISLAARAGVAWKADPDGEVGVARSRSESLGAVGAVRKSRRRREGRCLPDTSMSLGPFGFSVRVGVAQEIQCRSNGPVSLERASVARKGQCRSKGSVRFGNPASPDARHRSGPPGSPGSAPAERRGICRTFRDVLPRLGIVAILNLSRSAPDFVLSTPLFPGRCAAVVCRRGVPPWCAAVVCRRGVPTWCAAVVCRRGVPRSVLVGCSFMLRACHCCGLIQALPSIDGPAKIRCVRCHAPVRRSGSAGEKSASRTAAMSLAAFFLFWPAVCLPIVEIEQLGYRHATSLVEGTIGLLRHGDWLVGGVVLVFSIVFPFLKIVLLVELSLLRLLQRRHRALTYRVMEHAGKWSMMDVLLLAFLVMLVKVGDVVSFQFGPAVVAFVACVVTSMISSMCFDPHVLWADFPNPGEPSAPDARPDVRPDVRQDAELARSSQKSHGDPGLAGGFRGDSSGSSNLDSQTGSSVPPKASDLGRDASSRSSTSSSSPREGSKPGDEDGTEGESRE